MHTSITNNMMIISCVLTVLLISECRGQATFLDAPEFRPFFRMMRERSFDFLGRTGTDEYSLNYNKKLNKIQREFAEDEQFFCDINGPGARSATVPESVHKLRPGDIDVIGALGDSLTAGNGIIAVNILQLAMENRGMSWSGGGQGTWRKYLTLPNILKEFNPNLYGYALSDSLPFEKTSRFNAAELGAMSRDIPYMSKVLVTRMRGDPKVEMENHWKLITLLIGPNDFCSDMCYQKYPEKIVDYHENHLLRALRTLRDNLPRTMVNVVMSPRMDVLVEMKGRPNECISILYFECPCMFGSRFVKHYKHFLAIQSKWQRRQADVVYREEFQNKTDFVVNLQPYTEHIHFPTLTNGNADFSYMSVDCFHFSQRGNAIATNALWNNMLEPLGFKSHNWTKEFEILKCPTSERPYLATLENSIR